MFEYSSTNLPFPGDIRNEIYQQLLFSSCSTCSSDHHHNICGILGASKETRLETRLIYYSRTTWKFASARTAIRFFASLTPDLFPNIYTLILQKYPSDCDIERKLSGLLRKCCKLRSLEICMEESLIRSKLPTRGDPFPWDAKDLGLASLRGLQAFNICIHGDPSGAYKWKWRSTKLGLSLEYSKPALYHPKFTPLRVAIPPLITPPSRHLRQTQQRQQKLAQRTRSCPERLGTSSVIPRSKRMPPIYT